MNEKGSKNWVKIENDLQPYMRVLEQTTDTILTKDVSKYPIIVLHQQPIELGIETNIFVEDHGFVSASSLEEFSMKQLIRPDKIEDFQSIYKDPQEYICLFVVGDGKAQFVFLKRTNSSP